MSVKLFVLIFAARSRGGNIGAKIQTDMFSFSFSEEIVLRNNSSEEADHPLNPNPNSQWQSFFKDNEVLLQVSALDS